jgi:hypothetical protein
MNLQVTFYALGVCFFLAATIYLLPTVFTNIASFILAILDKRYEISGFRELEKLMLNGEDIPRRVLRKYRSNARYILKEFDNLVEATRELPFMDSEDYMFQVYRWAFGLQVDGIKMDFDDQKDGVLVDHPIQVLFYDEKDELVMNQIDIVETVIQKIHKELVSVDRRTVGSGFYDFRLTNFSFFLDEYDERFELSFQTCIALPSKNKEEENNIIQFPKARRFTTL